MGRQTDRLGAHVGRSARPRRGQPVHRRPAVRQSSLAKFQDDRRPARRGKCRDRAIAALCAEAVGAMTELNSATLEYTKTRKQFGVALGTFQVLQHRMVDMFIALQESISLTQHLNLTLAENEPGCSKLASGAKSKVGEAARFVGEQAVQLHGGMGMSDELNIGHYFKRIASINIQFGDP